MTPGYVMVEDSPAFPCYFPEKRQYWNGWAVPCFTKAQAEMVLLAFDIKYILGRGLIHVFDGDPISYYPVLAWNWCWEEVTVHKVERKE